MKISGSRDKLVELLNADAFFVDRTDPAHPVIKVPIVTKKIGDVDSAIDEKLAELGVGLLVLVRSAKPQVADSLDLQLAVQFGLMAVENPVAKDDTAPSAEDIAEAAWEILHGKRNGVSVNDESDLGRFLVERMQPIPPSPKKPFLSFQLLTVNTTIALTPR